MGLRTDDAVGRSFEQKVHSPIMHATGKRFGCSMISAITKQGAMAFMVFKGQFVTDVFLTFLKRLIRHSSGKVYLIIDCHPVRNAVRVRDWLEKHKEDIRLCFLPAYNPELNPDELVNQDEKTNEFRGHQPQNQSEMIEGVRAYMRSTQKRSDIVQRYFSRETCQIRGL